MHQLDLSISANQAMTEQRHYQASGQCQIGSLTEMIVSQAGAIQPYHLLPLLAQCAEQQRWLMWLSPNMPLNKSWLTSMGLTDSPIIHMDVCADTQYLLCQKVLEAGNSHVLIEWQGELDWEMRQALRERAEISGSHLVLIQRR